MGALASTGSLGATSTVDFLNITLQPQEIILLLLRTVAVVPRSLEEWRRFDRRVVTVYCV